MMKKQINVIQKEITTANSIKKNKTIKEKNKKSKLKDS